MGTGLRRLAVGMVVASTVVVGGCASPPPEGDVSAQVRELTDRAEILNLSTIYSDGVVHGRIDDIMSVFADDASTEVPADALVLDGAAPADAEPIRTDGAAALRAQYTGMVENLHPLPAVGLNRIVTLEGDTATGRSMSIIRFRDNPNLINLANYEDEYRRIDGRWKFTHRVIRVQKFEQQTGSG
ncbi:nuclear transport factor 2 family protein [Pseudonocardia pini]|uniref:nuclear transport factor 2 family protein n=1 Tax=Pseudonocardia pini TaxID=2758030 RepID=UPI0015F03120|nr:nuclear transport factor 2 family protein [Pseudonocardia pini]